MLQGKLIGGVVVDVGVVFVVVVVVVDAVVAFAVIVTVVAVIDFSVFYCCSCYY